MVQGFVSGKGIFGKLISSQSERLLVEKAVYLGSMPTDLLVAHRWDDNLDNLIWILHRVGRRFLESSEYNSYKHGLRIMSGPSSISIGITGGTALIHHSSNNSITHLQAVTDEPDTSKFRRETVHFSPLESWHHIAYLARVAATMRSTRLAALEQSTDPPLLETFLLLDRLALERMSNGTRFAMDV